MPTWYDAEVEKSADDVWSSLTDVDGVLAALPGAALAREGDAATGSLKCKLGGTQITYRISARAEIGEASFRTAVLVVTGKEARGGGTLEANLTVAVRDESSTRLEVSGAISATGRGENADDRAWRRLVGQLVNAVIPPAATPAKPAASPPPRPPLAVAPPPPLAPAKRPVPTQPIAYGLVAVVVLLLLRRLRRKRHG
jgi:carbon monoxide dehydrogenase subunit G